MIDLGGRTGVIGGLAGARQAEEAAGFVMRVVAAGLNPRFAVPDVDPELLHAATTSTEPVIEGGVVAHTRSRLQQ
jgi:hypothetical protein